MTLIGGNATVHTVCNVTIPPYSEALFPVNTRIITNGNFLMEDGLCAPVRSLMVAKTLVNPSKKNLQCRVLNPTDRAIKLRANTAVASLFPATVHDVKPTSAVATTTFTTTLSHDQMKAILEEKGMLFTDTAVTGEDFEKLIKLLFEYKDLIASSMTDLPGTDVAEFYIDTGDAQPIRKKGFRLSRPDQLEISRQIKELEAANIIQPSDSPWSANCLLVSKKNTTEKRLVIDYRFVNRVTRMTSHPLVSVDDIVDQMAEQQPMYFSSLDLRSGYHQIKLDPRTADRTAFSTPEGVWQWSRMPFGLSNAGSFFAATMVKVLKGLTNKICQCYLDDILCFSRTPDEMLVNLREILERFKSCSLKIHAKKCHFSTREVVFLGHK